MRCCTSTWEMAREDAPGAGAPVTWARTQRPAAALLMARDLYPEGMPTLDNAELKAAIEEAATEREVKLIILDNLSTLCADLRTRSPGTTCRTGSLGRGGSAVGLAGPHSFREETARSADPSRKEDVGCSTGIAAAELYGVDHRRGLQRSF